MNADLHWSGDESKDRAIGRFPPGRDEARVQCLIARYDQMNDDKLKAEDEAALARLKSHPQPRELTREDVWQTLCHEAGHAVAAILLGISFGHVERREVFIDVAVPDDDSTQDDISRLQQVYAAGAAAEKLLFGDYREYGIRIDRARHEKYEKLRTRVRSGGWETDIQSAMNILDSCSVQKVATELDRLGKLSEEDVSNIIGCDPPWIR